MIRVECAMCQTILSSYSQLSKHIIEEHKEQAIDMITFLLVGQDFDGRS